MGYPTGDAPVQLKLNPDDFEFLEAYGLNLTDMDEFAARVRQLSPAAAAAALGLFEQDRKPTPENRAEWDLAKLLLRRQSESAAAASTTGAGDDFGLEAYYGISSAKKQEIDSDSSGSDLLDFYNAVASGQQEFASEQTGPPFADEMAKWGLSDPLPTPQELAAMKGPRTEPRNNGNQQLFYRLTVAKRTFASFKVVTEYLFHADYRLARENAAVMARYQNWVESLNQGEFMWLARYLADEAHGYGDYINGHGAAKERIKAVKTEVLLHVFEFPGAAGVFGNLNTMVKAAADFYKKYGILVREGKRTVVSKAEAQTMFKDGAGKIFPYAAKFEYSDDAKGTSSDAVRAKYLPERGMVPVYAFGAWEDLNSGKALGVTFHAAMRKRIGDNPAVFIGPSGGYNLTLAHELGHLLGGHVGGAHTHEAQVNNLMHHDTTAPEYDRRLNLMQLLFFKTSPFATALKED